MIFLGSVCVASHTRDTEKGLHLGFCTNKKFCLNCPKIITKACVFPCISRVLNTLSLILRQHLNQKKAFQTSRFAPMLS